MILLIWRTVWGFSMSTRKDICESVPLGAISNNIASSVKIGNWYLWSFGGIFLFLFFWFFFSAYCTAGWILWCISQFVCMKLARLGREEAGWNEKAGRAGWGARGMNMNWDLDSEGWKSMRWLKKKKPIMPKDEKIRQRQCRIRKGKRRSTSKLWKSEAFHWNTQIQFRRWNAFCFSYECFEEGRHLELIQLGKESRTLVSIL